MTQTLELNLLSGNPILAYGSVHVRQVKLRELSDPAICGLDRYHQFLSIISMGLDDILKCLQIEDKYAQLSPKEREIFTSFRLLVEVPSLRQCLYEALSFFILEPLRFDAQKAVFLVGDSNSFSESISDETYPIVRRAIMQTNCLTLDELNPPKFNGRRGRAIYERIKARGAAAKELKAKAGADGSLTLPNIVSAVSARHHSLNLTNIWSLTVYQLYDQFAQINKNFQIDVSSLKWAAWGSEQFDFSLWYKSQKNN